MDTTAALAKYTAAMAQLKSHIASNQGVFDTHQQIVFKVMDAENELRDAVAEAGVGVRNNDYKVTITPQTQTWADIEEIDRIFENTGKVDKSQRDQIVKTQPRPPRISITEIQD